MKKVGDTTGDYGRLLQDIDQSSTATLNMKAAYDQQSA